MNNDETNNHETKSYQSIIDEQTPLQPNPSTTITTTNTNTTTKTLLKWYIVLGSILIGFTFGFSFGFLASTSYWQSSLGRYRLGTLGCSLKEEEEEEEGSENSPQDMIISTNFFQGLSSFNHPPPIREQSQRTQQPNIYMNHREAYELLLDSIPGSTNNNNNNNPNNKNNILSPFQSSSSSYSIYSTDYFVLSSGFDVEIHTEYGSIATVAAIMNSLRFLHPRSETGVWIPDDELYEPFAYATQSDLLKDNTCVNENVIRSDVSSSNGSRNGVLIPPFGLGLSQVAELLRCYLDWTRGWTVEEHVLDVTHVTLSKMRHDMRMALAEPDSRVLVNYVRDRAGQVGGGHWSPVGSYSSVVDAFLVMDVAKFKYPPVWITSVRLYRGMGTVDECGVWDFPEGQDRLSGELLNKTKREDMSEEEWGVVKDVLGCRDRLRGYIIVRRS